MKRVIFFGFIVMVMADSIRANPNRDIQALQAIRAAGELAFERNDIKTIEQLWLDDDDVLMTTPLGTRYKGFPKIKAALMNLFALLGQTTIETEDLFFTVVGEEASITMKYLWSVLPGVRLDLLERYRNVDGKWKIYASDSQGELVPLRPEDEKKIKQLASSVQGRILAKDIAQIADLTADDFTYIDKNGAQTKGWQESANVLSADVETLKDLQLQSIALIGNQACAWYTLTPIDDQTLTVQLTFVGPNEWKLAHIRFAPQDALAVAPNRRLTITWAKLKTERQ